MANIAVLGAGYVGLTTAACFAKLGNSVIVSDVDPQRISDLNAGLCPIVEDGLQTLLEEGVAKSALVFVTDNKFAVAKADFVFLCLPTPQSPDGTADTSYVEGAAAEIAGHINESAVVVTKSTVPVGSSKIIEKALSRSDIAVVSNPEFLREGSALNDFFYPDRVVIGSNNLSAAQKVAGLYATMNAKIIITDPASAETIKYAANAFLATKISFINAVAAVCEGVGADVLDVIEGIGSDSRIGRAFLSPGPGWGGSCFPKDTKAMVRIADDAGYNFALLRGVIDVNDQQHERIVSKVLSCRIDNMKDFRVCILGLTFKAGTDDRRDSPAVKIAQMLLAQNIKTCAYDPTVAMHSQARDLVGIDLHKSTLECVHQSDVILVATEWPEFKELDPRLIGEKMRSKNVVDARNILDADVWKSAGFVHIGVGR